MTYRIVEATGEPIAEIKFNSAINGDLTAVYMQEICAVLDAGGYHSIVIPAEEEA